MPYIFNADTYCDRCIEPMPTKPNYPPPYDTDDYPMHVSDCGESDSPCHCGGCGEPLDYSLTQHGIKYVLDSIVESIQEALRDGRAQAWDRIMPLKGTGEESHTFWHGSRHVDIMRDWAEKVREYNLERDEQAIVELFLELSAA